MHGGWINLNSGASETWHAMAGGPGALEASTSWGVRHIPACWGAAVLQDVLVPACIRRARLHMPVRRDWETFCIKLGESRWSAACEQRTEQTSLRRRRGPVQMSTPTHLKRDVPVCGGLVMTSRLALGFVTGP